MTTRPQLTAGPRRSPERAVGLLGVTRNPGPKDRFNAGIAVGHETHWLGTWDLAKRAGLAYDRAYLHFHKNAQNEDLNFPKEARRLGPADPVTLVAEARTAFKGRTSSRFRGVSFDRFSKRWQAYLSVNLVAYDLGRHDTEEEAARAYDAQAFHLLGTRAKLNFHPKTGEETFGRPWATAALGRKSASSAAPKAKLLAKAKKPSKAKKKPARRR